MKLTFVYGKDVIGEGESTAAPMIGHGVLPPPAVQKKLYLGDPLVFVSAVTWELAKGLPVTVTLTNTPPGGDDDIPF